MQRGEAGGKDGEQSRDTFRFLCFPIRLIFFKTWIKTSDRKRTYCRLRYQTHPFHLYLFTVHSFPSYELFREKGSYLQLDNPPPFRAVLSLHIFAFCSQESGDGSEDRAESQRSTTSLSVRLSVSGMDIYIYRSARLHFCLALHYHLTTEYIYMYTNTPVVGRSQLT